MKYKYNRAFNNANMICMQNIYETFEFNRILTSLSEFSKSDVGKEKILTLKMLSKEEVEQENEILKEITSIVYRFGPIPIENSADALYLINLAKKTGLLTPRDLNLIANDVITSKNVTNYLNKLGLSYPILQSKVDGFVDLSTLEKEIHFKITTSLTVDDHASSKLFEIRTKLKKANHDLESKGASLVYKYASYLSDENPTIRDGHFVLPVKTGFKNSVIGAIYDVSASGNTTFIEPLEIISLNNEITALKVEENDEVRRILKELTNIVLLQEYEILNNNRIIGELDFENAKALYGQANNLEIGEMSDKPYVDIVKGRHPLLDPHKVISNSYRLDQEKRIIVISGPNAGGKTVSLKTVGIIVLMHQCGLPIPVSKATLGYFRNIFIDIGDNQSITDNLSTFSAHMSHISEITSICRSTDLILLDELGTGTDPKEGEAIALAVTKALLKSHCFALLSSHFSSLKEFALTNPNIVNSSMIFDEDKLAPTYVFKMGIPGRSYGLEVAERYGIKKEIINDAKEYITNNYNQKSEELIAELQRKVEESIKLESSLKKDKEKLEKQLIEIEQEKQKLDKRREYLLNDVTNEKNKLINDAKNEIDQIIKQLAKGDLTLKEVVELKNKINNLEEKEEIETFDEPIKANDSIEIPSLELFGTVDRINGHRAHVITDTGISLEVDLNRLKKAPKVEKRRIHKSSHSVDIDTKVIPIECNLIGLHVDEAKDKLMMYLDECRYKRMSQVRIIHGFGSGALRKMTHEYLSKQKDLTFRLGDAAEGGGGATVIKFNDR